MIGQVKTTEDAVKPLPYGDEFTYGESNLARGPISAALTSFAIALGVVSLLFFPPLRWLVQRLAPKPGEGPSDECVPFNLLPIHIFPDTSMTGRWNAVPSKRGT